MKTKLQPDQLQVIQANNGLKLYLESLLKGKDSTPRSWLYENESADEIRDRWLEKLEPLQTGSTYEQNVFHFDTSQLEKWGPQGGVAPITDLLAEVVLPSFSATPNTPEAFNTGLWEEAKRITRHFICSRIGEQVLRPAPYESVYDDMRARDVLESNSGWPDFTRRSKPEVRDAALDAARDGTWRSYPAIALFRNYNQKTRLVWMYPMSTNLVEGSFMQPLFEQIRYLNDRFFAPWEGFEAVRRQISQVYANRNGTVAASDFSATDAHFQWTQTEQVFDVIKHAFQRKYWDSLQESLYWMNNIPLIIGPNEMLTGHHGVSSGSNWTNFVETIFDKILAVYVQLLSKGRMDGLYAIGDDMAWFSFDYDPNFAEQLEEIGASVGQQIKADKTTNDRDKVKSLQRLFQRGYCNPGRGNLVRGVYSTIRALKSSVFPERFHSPKQWNWEMFAVRQFAILENCVDHPLFEDFVRFVCDGNNHLYEFATQTSSRINLAAGKAKFLPGLNTTYNQEKRDQKLSTYESVLLAARIAREGKS